MVEEEKEPGVALSRLDKLSRGIIVGDIEPETVRDGSWYTFPHAKRVATDKISTLDVGIIKGVEEERGGGCQQVTYVLRQSIYLFASRILGNLFFHNNRSERKSKMANTTC